MKTNRTIALFLALAMLVGVTGCVSTPSATPAPAAATPAATPVPAITPAPASAQPAATAAPAEPPKSLWPLTEEKATFKVFTQVGGATVEDIVTNGFSAWYEEKTGVHIDWEVVTSGAGQQIPLKIAANDLPDAFFGNLSDVQISTYALIDKVFVPLDDAIDKNAPNVKKMLAESEVARAYSYMPDGHIYSLLRVVDTYNERVTKRAWVYEPWLTTLNIKMPETTDAFYDMLVAFRDQDPNGNGKKDEIPYAGALMGNPANNEPEAFLLNSFVYYDNTTFLELDADGKTVKFVTNTPEYREGLRYLKKLYDEKLLASESWTQDRKGLQAAVEGGDVNTLGVAAAMYWGHFSTENGPSGRDKEFTAVPVLEGPGGVRNAYDRGMLVNNGKLVATTACKNVDLLVKWADWFFDADAMMDSGYSANYGQEGVGWRRANPGELNINGEQAKYKYLRPVDQKQNDNWFQTEPYYESKAYLDSIVNDDMNRKEAFGGQQTTEKYMPYSALSKKLPFMYFPLENIDEIVALRDQLTNTTTGEINVHRNKFITGELSLDTDWDAYLETLNRVGLDQYIANYQSMYDNYLKVQSQVK